MAPKKPSPTPVKDVTPTVITPETTFDDLFETMRLSIPIPVFVGLLPSLDNKEYLQPNVNHHFLNDGHSFHSLDAAFKKWVKEGIGPVSTEFNAILMEERYDKPKDDDSVAFSMFNVSSKSLNEKIFGEVEWDCHHVQKKFIDNISSYDYDEHDCNKDFPDLKKTVKCLFGTNSYEDGHYFLGFTDGSHRTTSLWNLVLSLNENDFREFILKNTKTVTVHLSYLKKDIRIQHRHLPQLNAIVQNQSGFIMQSKQQSIGHTLFDCYDSFALNSKAMEFRSILDCVGEKSISLIDSKNNGEIFKDDPLTTVLQNLFLQFMLNNDFAKLCTIQRKRKAQQEVTFWDKNAVELYFPGALNQDIWFPILFQALPFQHASDAIQKPDWQIKSTKRKDFDLPYQCAMLFSLCRLFTFSSKMTTSILSAMDSMEKSSILTQYRLSFIQSVAYDASDFLVKYFTKYFSQVSHRSKEGKTTPLHANWMIRYVLRCNLEQQLLLLYQLVGTKALLSCKDEFELNDCESEAIKNLHQREGNTEEDVRIADKLVFIYARYLVLLLSLDSVHVQSLPILNMLLSTDKSERELSHDVYLQREKDVDAYRDSCMIGREVILGSKKLDLGPKNFINSLFEKSKTKLDPRALILDWLEDVNSNEVVESTQVSYHKDSKRSSVARFNKFSDVVAFVKNNIDELMCWFSRQKAEKKKNTEEHTDPLSKKHGKESQANQAVVDKDIAEEKIAEEKTAEDQDTLTANDNSPNEDAVKKAAVDEEDVTEEKMMEDRNSKEAANEKRTTKGSHSKTSFTLSFSTGARVQARPKKLPLHKKRSTAEKSNQDVGANKKRKVKPGSSTKKSKKRKGSRTEKPGSSKEIDSSSTDKATNSQETVGKDDREESSTDKPGSSKEIDSSSTDIATESSTDKPGPSGQEVIQVAGSSKEIDSSSTDIATESSTDEPGPSAEENIQVDLNLWNEFVDTITDDKIKTILKNPDKEYCHNWYNVTKLPVDGDVFLKHFQKVAKSKNGKNQEQLIRDELYKSHIEYVNVEGDGNCFFRCIAYQLEGSEDNHFSWRFVLCNWMSFLKEKGKINPNLGLDDSHITELCQDGTYVDDFGISFLSRLLQRHIIILSEADSYDVCNGGPHVEKLDGKERRSLYLVFTNAREKRMKSTTTYKRKMKAAREKGDDAVAKLEQEAEELNHYITFVPQYKEESPLPANINDIIPPIFYLHFKTWFEAIYKNPDPTKWTEEEKKRMAEIKKQLKEYAQDSDVSDA